MLTADTDLPRLTMSVDVYKRQGVTLGQGYNGELTAKQAGSVGGQMVKKMIESYENQMK